MKRRLTWIAPIVGAVGLLSGLVPVASASVTNGQIVFVRSSGAGAGIYVADPDGSNAHALPVPVDGQGPTWSPDGSRITYSAPIAGQGSAIWVVNADGTDPHVVADTPSLDIVPKWSPDGSRISFNADFGGGLPNYEVFIAMADGSGYSQFTHTDPSETASTWSPDGSSLAFFRGRSLITAPISGDGDGTVVTTFAKGATVTSPSWSPDGSTFVFLQGRTTGENWDVARISVTGKSLKRLTRDKLPDGDPTWSPDGASILWGRVVGGEGQIWRMDADGANQVAITTPGSGSFDFSPDQETA